MARRYRPLLYSLAEILRRFPEAARALPKKFRFRAFADIAKGLEVFFVETKRLDAAQATTGRTESGEYIVSRSPKYFVYDDTARRQGPPLRVDQDSRDLVQRIKSALADYAKHSQESDRTFPERLVRFVRDGDEALPARQIVESMNDLESKRQRLISLGFLDSESGLRDLTEEDVRRAPEALTIYVRDVEGKLTVFDDLARRVG